MVMDLLLLVLAVVGIGIGVIFYFYGRNQGSKKVAAVTLVRGIMQRTEGILAGIKPSISDPAMISAINDGLAAISKASKQLEAI
jgi:RsiW-degrading membrane proteinase PrsW (M82 family)